MRGLEFEENQRSKRNQRSKLDSDNPAETGVHTGVDFAETLIDAGFQVAHAGFQACHALAKLFNDSLDAGEAGVEIGRCGCSWWFPPCVGWKSFNFRLVFTTVSDPFTTFGFHIGCASVSTRSRRAG